MRTGLEGLGRRWGSPGDSLEGTTCPTAEGVSCLLLDTRCLVTLHPIGSAERLSDHQRTLVVCTEGLPTDPDRSLPRSSLRRSSTSPRPPSSLEVVSDGRSQGPRSVPGVVPSCRCYRARRSSSKRVQGSLNTVSTVATRQENTYMTR